MQILATHIRVGNVLVMDGELYKVNYRMHVTPGKGVACVQTKLKNIINGRNKEHRFRSNDKIEKANLETQNMQYLYAEPGGHIFMDNESYEQMTLTETLLEGQTIYLKEGDSYDVTFYDGNAVGLELPTNMEFKVDYAPPEIKKATANNSMRPITLENGLEVNAPAFIKNGDVIKVNTETNEYVERV